MKQENGRVVVESSIYINEYLKLCIAGSMFLLAGRRPSSIGSFVTGYDECMKFAAVID